MKALSVNLSEILAHRPEQEKIRAVARIFIIIQLTVRLHTLSKSGSDQQQGS